MVVFPYHPALQKMSLDQIWRNRGKKKKLKKKQKKTQIFTGLANEIQVHFFFLTLNGVSLGNVHRFDKLGRLQSLQQAYQVSDTLSAVS